MCFMHIENRAHWRHIIGEVTRCAQGCNNAALLNSRNPVKSKTQKHLDVYHHITRENQMEFKTINVYRLPTDRMRADLMTKNLPKPTFWRHVINSYNYEPKDYSVNGIHFQAWWIWGSGVFNLYEMSFSKIIFCCCACRWQAQQGEWQVYTMALKPM